MAITRIAGATATGQDSSATLTCPSASFNSTGLNFIAAAVSCSGTLSSVTDTSGNHYALIGPYNGGGGDSIYLAYTDNPSTVIGGAGHIVSANSGATTFKSISLACYAGLANVSVLDLSTTHGSGTGTALSSGASASTSQAIELVIGFGTLSTGSSTSFTAGGSFAMQAQVGNGTVGGLSFLEDFIASSISAFTATATCGVSGGWDCGVATFRGQVTLSASRNNTFHPGRSPGKSPVSARFYQVPRAYAVTQPSSGAMTGIAIAAHTLYGDMSGAAALSGLAISTTIAFGQMTGAAPLTGLAVATTASFGNLNGSGALTGLAISTTSSFGAMAGAAALSGLAITQSDAFGQMTGSASINGLAISTAAAWGDLQALTSGAMQGIAITSHSAYGALTGTVSVSGLGVTTTVAFGRLTGSTPGGATHVEVVNLGLSLMRLGGMR